MNREILPQEEWFNWSLLRMKNLNKLSFDEQLHFDDCAKINQKIDAIIDLWSYELGWNISYEIHEKIPLMSIAVFDIEAPFGEILNSCEEMRKIVELNWIFRCELYPQIKNGIKTGESACAEFLVSKDRICGWYDDVGKRKLTK